MKLALVCSSGGHLYELFLLDRAWKSKERFWVSFPTADATHLLKDERVVWAHYPTNRNVPNLLRNLWLSFKVLRAERPDAVISTGAGVALPFMLCAKALGIRTIFIESIARSEELSLTGRLCLPLVDTLLTQSPELARQHKKLEFKGRVL